MNQTATGKLWGVGVGPGDPELLTLKAKRILETVDCIAVPRSAEGRDSTALAIAAGAVDIDKPIIDLVFPMSFDESVLGEGWAVALASLLEALAAGKQVAFVTLGDPTVYSTYMYLHRSVLAAGHAAEIIPGITSFCAAAARAGISLAENRETLAVIPAAYESGDLDAVLDSFDNVVLMKVARRLGEVRRTLARHGLEDKSILVSRCGQSDELVETDLACLEGRKLSYFTTLIVKKGSSE